MASAISAFTGSVSEARGLAAEVDQASRQQQQGLEQVAASVAQMERVTQSAVSLGAVAKIAALVGETSGLRVLPSKQHHATRRRQASRAA